MIWIGIGMVALAVAFMYAAKQVSDAMRARNAPEEPLDDAPAPRAPRSPEERQEEEDLAVADMIRQGPRGMEARQLDGWREEMRREGKDERAIDALLANREPILSL